MKEVGMTDKQFNGFIRLLIDNLEHVRDEKDEQKKAERLKRVIENLQNTLED